LHESHWARLLDWASDLVDRGVAVLVASGSVLAIPAAKAATTTIPIVFGFGADPIETASFPASIIREATSPVSPS